MTVGKSVSDIPSGSIYPDKILVVEDSPTQAIRVQHLLESHGFSVSIAKNGQTALQYLNQDIPSVVVSDVVMPEMNGYELCRSIRLNPALEDVPVILLTALYDFDEIVRGLESGADCFLIKAYQEKNLISSIRSILADKGLGRRPTLCQSMTILFSGNRYELSTDIIRGIHMLLASFQASVEQCRELDQENHELIKAYSRISSETQKVSVEYVDNQANYIAKTEKITQIGSQFPNSGVLQGDATAAAQPTTVSTQVADRNNRGLNVLLAEDSSVNRTLAVRLLEKMGHSVAVSINGLEAVEAFKKSNFDMILMDVQMPDMDGLEATIAIRSCEKGSRVPIIALTANASEEDVKECMEAGMDGFLSKPLNRNELSEVIEKILGKTT
jgi:CheY-like chemotaxis protein